MHSINAGSNWELGRLTFLFPKLEVRDGGPPSWLTLSFEAAAASSARQLCLWQASDLAREPMQSSRMQSGTINSAYLWRRQILRQCVNE